MPGALCRGISFADRYTVSLIDDHGSVVCSLGPSHASLHPVDMNDWTILPLPAIPAKRVRIDLYDGHLDPWVGLSPLPLSSLYVSLLLYLPPSIYLCPSPLSPSLPPSPLSLFLSLPFLFCIFLFSFLAPSLSCLLLTHLSLSFPHSSPLSLTVSPPPFLHSLPLPLSFEPPLISKGT